MVIMIKNVVFVLIFWVVPSVFSQEDKGIYIIDIETFTKEVVGKDVQLIDIRSPREYNEGHIDDAININFYNKDLFLREFQKLDKSKPIYIYCYSGGRSHRASQKLKDLGFKEIYDFKGGYKEWRAQ